MAVAKVQSTWRLDVDIYAKLKKIAVSESRSVANMLDYLIKKEIKRYEAENGVIELSEEDLSLE